MRAIKARFPSFLVIVPLILHRHPILTFGSISWIGGSIFDSPVLIDGVRLSLSFWSNQSCTKLSVFLGCNVWSGIAGSR